MKTKIWLALSVAPLFAACGASPETSERGPVETVAKGAPITLAVAPNTPTTVFARTKPYAQCSLHDAISPSSDVRAHYVANQDGVIRLQVNVREPGSANAALDCQVDGERTVYPVTLTLTTDEAALAETRDRMAPLAQSKSGRDRPPLPGDPEAYTTRWLLENGYGLRPNPVGSPDEYARWLTRATQPGTIASSTSIPGARRIDETAPVSEPMIKGGCTPHAVECTQCTQDSKSKTGYAVICGNGCSAATATPCTPEHGINQDVVWNSIWSGVVASNPGNGATSFGSANVTFRVPQVFAESNIANHTQASTWAGIGGVGTPLWQAGIEEYTDSGAFFESAGYTAWWELAPNNNQQNISMTVNAGDEIFVNVWICDRTSFNTVTPSYATASFCAQVDNLSSNANWFQNFSFASLGYTATNLTTAEVIQERPGSGGTGLYDFAQFNPFGTVSQGACGAPANPSITPGCGGLTHGSPYSLKIWDMGNPTYFQGWSCLADANGSCDDNGESLWFYWHSHT